MKRLAALVVIVALSGCSSEQQVRHHEDFYNPTLNSVTIFNVPTLQDAQLKANGMCKGGKAFAVPELRELDLKRLQEQKSYRVVDPAGYHFTCSEMESLRIRGEYGDKPSKARYDRMLKAQVDEMSRQNAEEYKKIEQAAKAPGIHTITKTLPDGSIMTRSFGNGVLCESVYDENGGYSSCDNVDE